VVDWSLSVRERGRGIIGGGGKDRTVRRAISEAETRTVSGV